MAKISINLGTGTLQQQEIIVGIDLGTTNSLIAMIHPDTGQPTVLKEYDGSSLVPSVIHFNSSGSIEVGTEALPYLTNDPANTIFSVKRLMGKSYQDIRNEKKNFSYNIVDDGTGGLVKVEVGGKWYSPIELSSFVLSALKKRAEHILKTPVNKAVVTVPAYFNDAQRQATRDAGRLAGLDVLRIINEPTAASLAYGIGLSRDEDRTIAVYDLGGGTFDVSILRINAGVFEVLSTNGDTYLGGDDFNTAIVNFWLQQNNSKQVNQSNDQTFSQLRLAAEEAKKALSSQLSFETTVAGKTYTLTRNQFEHCSLNLIQRTINACAAAVHDSGLSPAELDQVLMVGGATRIPAVQEAVKNFFGKPLYTALNPDEVVALGAAIQADILSGNNRELLLLDVTPLSLGIETMGGLMDVLIPRNSKVPIKAARQYTTQKDGQASIRISVFQGERDLVEHNRKLAEFQLTGIPGMPAGLPKVEVSFLVNADGILSVTAKELRSGVAQTIEVRPQLGLTDQEIERLLLESLTHAKDDIKTRALVEAQTEGRTILDTTNNFIQKHAAHLSEIEVQSTNAIMKQLETLLKNGTKDEIQAAIDVLNNISKPFAERVMDLAVRQALLNKSINQ